MTSTVVVRKVSPNGANVALLIDRHYHAARVSDEFFITVISANADATSAVNSRHLGSSSVLVATLANNVQLEWQSENSLLVLCNSCGLEAVDIEKKTYRAGAVAVVYQGFPQHIANE
jgi:hypothetical protein